MSKGKAGAKIYLPESVFDAALNRIRWLFAEFENVVVNTSGGKDSTIILNLALIVAEEQGRLPLRVMFLDQEIEWDATIDYIRYLRDDPRIKLDWLQVPFKVFNATSAETEWLYCWQPDTQWTRDKEPDSITENIYGTDRFAELLSAYQVVTYNNQLSVAISGVRAAETPARFQGLTTRETHKGQTWGARRNKNTYTFYPIYDWETSDVWKAIHDNDWRYNRAYDYMYRYGVPIPQMRVSNINHETALKSVYFFQEVEPDNWQRIAARLAGMNTVNQMKDQFFGPSELPFMFSSWREYRDHLLENLVLNPDNRAKMHKMFLSMETRYLEIIHEKMFHDQIQCILANDVYGTKLKNFQIRNLDYLRRG